MVRIPRLNLPTHIASQSETQALVAKARDGATVDLAAVRAAMLQLANVDQGRALVTDLLESPNVTPAAREALTAFMNASADPSSASSSSSTPGFDGLVGDWWGVSPPTRARSTSPENRLSDGIEVARYLSQQPPEETLGAALAAVDPLLADLVRFECKYSMGLNGIAGMFPELKEALATFTSAHEPATTLMAIALQALPPAPTLASVVNELEGGTQLDLKRAVDLVRGAIRDGVRPEEIARALEGFQVSEGAQAFLSGFLSTDGSVSERVLAGVRSHGHARERAFEKALAEVNPSLANLGHSILLTGSYPHLLEARAKVRDLTAMPGDSWSEQARRMVVAALHNDGIDKGPDHE